MNSFIFDSPGYGGEGFCTVFGLDALSKASAGVAVAGFFGEDWSVARGEFAWRDKTSPIK